MAQQIHVRKEHLREPRGLGRSRLWLLVAVFGGPLAWGFQFCANAAIASYPCVPGSTIATTAPVDFPTARTILYIINIVALLATVAAAWVAWRIRRDARGEGDDAPAATILAERLSRTRYLAAWGVIFALASLATILFGLVMIIGAPAQC